MRWNRTIARVRIHGTTRRQVFAHFEETDKKALGPLATAPLPFFQRGTRTVHPDGHVEVEGSFYPAPPQLVGRDVEIRVDRHLVRVFEGETLVAVHARVRPGEYARSPGSSQGPSSSQRAFLTNLLARCERVGTPLKEWAEAAHEERGIRALRLIQGVLALVRKRPREIVVAATKTALTNRLFRYKDLRRLCETTAIPQQRSLLDVHETIRPMTDYRLENL